MSRTFRSDDWQDYRMEYKDPHRELESPQREREVVDAVLDMLVEEGILPHKRYDGGKLAAHREAVADRFEIPWTAITPRMQRLLYAINAILRPPHMIAAGIFCGNTFISNAGAGVGPGACYEAEDLVGIEIVPDEAERAERNVRSIDSTGVAHIEAADAVPYVRDYPDPIELLYLDADGTPQTGKGVYLDILQAGFDRMPRGAVVLAHNSVNCAERLRHYLDFVRDPAKMKASVNVIFDVEGLEVSVK